MNAKLVVILAGALAVAGCNVIPDPTVFPYSKDQVQKMLVDSNTTLPRRDGPGEIRIWGDYRTAKGVKLNMKYASRAPQLECEAIVTSISPKETRVVADCGKSGNSESAIARTQDALRAPMFEEHIAATLHKRAFNRSKVDAKNSVAVFQNLGGMQQEALQRSAEARRMIEEHGR
jgi:hypothetical protein